MEVFPIPADVMKNSKDLTTDVLDDQGVLKIMPASYYASTSNISRGMLGGKYGHYVLPTIELVEFLRSYIGDRSAIEIGSGNGVLAQALDIPATDSYLHDDESIRKYYKALGQVSTPYGRFVERIDGVSAAIKYKPDVIIGAWVTHRWDSTTHDGNYWGVDEDKLLDFCSEYIFIGNEKVHANKPLWKHPTKLAKETPPWLFSRAVNGSPDFIVSWVGRKSNTMTEKQW
jgi:hypothetical protein